MMRSARESGEAFFTSILDEAFARAPQAELFVDRLLKATGIRFQDIVDHIVLPVGLRPDQGWELQQGGGWRHCSDALPDLFEADASTLTVAFRVEDIDVFKRAWGLSNPVEGAPYGPLRRTLAFAHNGVTFEAVQRHGGAGFRLQTSSPRQIRRARIHRQIFFTRRRVFREAANGYSQTRRLIEAAVADLGEHWASAAFLHAEREYWKARCATGALLGLRLARAGVGWCNVDYMVFCASRDHYQEASAAIAALGYRAGLFLTGESQAAAGTQIYECPDRSRPAILLSVDAAASEVRNGFFKPAASPLTWLGQAGLWCAMHGESLLEGGARYLAARCDVGIVNGMLQEEGVETQRLTRDADREALLASEGNSAVCPSRVLALSRQRYLGRAAAEGVRLEGAVAQQLILRQGGASRGGYVVPAVALTTSTADELGDGRRRRNRRRAPARKRENLTT